jgi:putative ABC transport system permease protein
LIEGGFVQDFRGAEVDAGFFDFFSARPLLGRWLTAEETQSRDATLIVISYQTWQTRFGGDPGILGRQIRMRDNWNREALHTVIGVMPPAFRFPAGDCAFWQALRPDPIQLSQPRESNYWVFVRRGANVSVEKAQAALDVLHSAMVQEFDANPMVMKPSESVLRLRPLMDFFVDAKVRRSVWVVAVAAAVVLLIVCSNLALLQLARGEARKSEMAVRVALGAGRFRILRQLLFESLLLAGVGGLGGLVLARWLRRLGEALLPSYAPVVNTTGIDGPVLAWTLGVAAACGILFGFFPAWRAGDARPAQVLRNTTRAASGGKAQRWFQRGLVATQIAFAMILLCAAGLLLRSTANLLKADRGFETAGLVEIDPGLRVPSYRTPEHQAAVTREIVDHLTALPGTTAVAMSGVGPGMSYYREGDGDPVVMTQTPVSVGTADYFQTLRMRLKDGRWFTGEDDRPGANTVVIDAAAAKSLWPGESPVGKRLYTRPGQSQQSSGPPSPQWGPFEVVGVVENLRFSSLETTPEPAMVVPAGRVNSLGRNFYLRTTMAPAALVAAINRISKEVIVGANQPKIAWIEERLYASTEPRRMMMWSALALAGVGLFLAMLGVFGVQLQAVIGRTREIGIRMALGADHRALTRMVLVQGMTMVLAGALLGMGGAWWLTKALGGLLHGITPNDPLTFTLMPLLLGAVALLACWLPARRAARVDPMVALRAE